MLTCFNIEIARVKHGYLLSHFYTIDGEGNLIKGKSVSIRNIGEKDLDSFYRLSSNLDDAGEFMPVNLVSETIFKNEFLRHGFWQDHSGRLLIETNSGDIVGEIGCFKVAHYLDGREVYYRIFGESRAKGYGAEALRLFIDFFFKSSSLNRIQGVTVIGNEVSEYMLKQAGFRFEGTMRQARYFKGGIVDLNLYSLLRNDWFVREAHYDKADIHGEVC